MAAHNILSKCDQALVAYLVGQNAGSSTDVFPAKNSLDKPLPCTICWSEHGDADPPYSGNYLVTARVMVRTLAAVDVNQDPNTIKGNSDDRVAATFDAFFTAVDTSGASLADLITQAGPAGFTAQNVRVMGVEQGYDDQHGKAMKGMAWVDTIILEIECCPSDLGG